MKPIAADEMFPEGIDGIEDVSNSEWNLFVYFY